VGFSRPLAKTENKGFSMEEIYVDTLTTVIPETHTCAFTKSLRLHKLEAAPFVLFKRKEAVGLFDQIISACQREKFTPVISSQPENMQTVIIEVGSGFEVSVVPGCVRKMYAKGCVFIPIQKQNPSIPTELHYRSDPSLPTVESFVELTMKAMRDIQRHVLK
jgi:DNA-binding transcriptional LysR family regulator